jgi:hypothetical protein
MTSADSVILVSHEPTAGISYIDEKTGKESDPEPLLIKSEVNWRIIREASKVNKPQLGALIQILGRPIEDGLIKTSRCFIPHHAILLFNKKDISYLDICFSCRSLSGRNIAMHEGDFDERKWNELLNFFRQAGLKYELDGVKYEE